VLRVRKGEETSTLSYLLPKLHEEEMALPSDEEPAERKLPEQPALATFIMPEAPPEAALEEPGCETCGAKTGTQRRKHGAAWSSEPLLRRAEKDVLWRRSSARTAGKSRKAKPERQQDRRKRQNNRRDRNDRRDRNERRDNRSTTTKAVSNAKTTVATVARNSSRTLKIAKFASRRAMSLRRANSATSSSRAVNAIVVTTTSVRLSRKSKT
jgi:hypothetical protein